MMTVAAAVVVVLLGLCVVDAVTDVGHALKCLCVAGASDQAGCGWDVSRSASCVCFAIALTAGVMQAVLLPPLSARAQPGSHKRGTRTPHKPAVRPSSRRPASPNQPPLAKGGAARMQMQRNNAEQRQDQGQSRVEESKATDETEEDGDQDQGQGQDQDQGRQTCRAQRRTATTPNAKQHNKSSGRDALVRQLHQKFKEQYQPPQQQKHRQQHPPQQQQAVLSRASRAFGEARMRRAPTTSSTRQHVSLCALSPFLGRQWRRCLVALRLYSVLDLYTVLHQPSSFGALNPYSLRADVLAFDALAKALPVLLCQCVLLSMPPAHVADAAANATTAPAAARGVAPNTGVVATSLLPYLSLAFSIYSIASAVVAYEGGQTLSKIMLTGRQSLLQRAALYTLRYAELAAIVSMATLLVFQPLGRAALIIAVHTLPTLPFVLAVYARCAAGQPMPRPATPQTRSPHQPPGAARASPLSPASPSAAWSRSHRRPHAGFHRSGSASATPASPQSTPPRPPLPRTTSPVHAHLRRVGSRRHWHTPAHALSPRHSTPSTRTARAPVTMEQRLPVWWCYLVALVYWDVRSAGGAEQLVSPEQYYGLRTLTYAAAYALLAGTPVFQTAPIAPVFVTSALVLAVAWVPTRVWHWSNLVPRKRIARDAADRSPLCSPAPAIVQQQHSLVSELQDRQSAASSVHRSPLVPSTMRQRAGGSTPRSPQVAPSPLAGPDPKRPTTDSITRYQASVESAHAMRHQRAALNGSQLGSQLGSRRGSPLLSSLSSRLGVGSPGVSSRNRREAAHARNTPASCASAVVPSPLTSRLPRATAEASPGRRTRDPLRRRLFAPSHSGQGTAAAAAASSPSSSSPLGGYIEHRRSYALPVRRPRHAAPREIRNHPAPAP